MNWQPYTQAQRRITSPALRDWLSDTGSLTERLIDKSGGQFRVELLSQSWGRANLDESLNLNLAFRHRVLVREVVLYGAGTPWVYARSLLPASSLEGPLRYLKRLGTKPLGALLFSSASMRRGEIEIRSYCPDELPDPVLSRLPSTIVDKAGSDRTIWGRRSTFWLSNHPLLVSEIFLPTFDL